MIKMSDYDSRRRHNLRVIRNMGRNNETDNRRNNISTIIGIIFVIITILGFMGVFNQMPQRQIGPIENLQNSINQAVNDAYSK
jgi:uncharacterized membrane protein YkgB